MEGKITKSSLLNAYAATDINTATAGLIKITGLLPIPTDCFKSATPYPSVAEMSQMYTVGSSSSPVVSAATKYQVKIGNTGNRREGAQSQLLPFGYTAPEVLTGNAFSDRHNLFTSLASKINRTSSVFATAYALASMPYDGQGATDYVLGELVTGSVSGATGIILQDDDNGATGTITLGNVIGTFVDNENLTGATSGSVGVANIPGGWANQTGFGLRIVDFPGYYSSLPYDTQTGNFTVGLVVTGATSGATGRIIADTDEGGVTGTLILAGVVGKFVDNEVVADTSTGSAAANIPGGWNAQTGISYLNNHSGTDGYYGPYTGSFRRGQNTVLVTAGFATSDLVLTATGVVSKGLGNKMMADVPVRELTSGNLAKGYWSFATNNPPLANAFYTTVVIVSDCTAFQDALSDNAMIHNTVQVLYLNEADADLAATLAALAAL